jgi:mono/diheme cytochrome c family protein
MNAYWLGGCVFVAAFLAVRPAAADEQPAATEAAAPAALASSAAGTAMLYRVVDGDQVDADTLKGWKTWRAMACDRCHGPNQEGLVGPSLVQSLKVLTKEQFEMTVLNGRIERGMPNFGGAQTVVENVDRLYAYLKGRSDGAIKPGKLRGIE